MKLHELVTVVIPCKNEEFYIDGVLKSLYMQHHLRDVRIIIADADSTDLTLWMILDWKHSLNIEVIQGGTVSEGRNNGASLVTTPYILFLDADVRLFDDGAIWDAVKTIHEEQLDLVTLSPKNYGKDWRASLLYWTFGKFNKVFSYFTPFAIGAFFLTRKSKFDQLGGFPNKYHTSEDFILSKQYDQQKFKIVNHYFGQDERRFKKMGYFGMIKYMVTNFFNRNNLQHFEKSTVNYWD